MPPPVSYLDIASLPFSQLITQAEFNGGTYGGVANQLWLRYVASGKIGLGVDSNLGGTWSPRFVVYESDGSTILTNPTANSFWVPLQIGTYYIKVTDDGGGVSDFDFTLNITEITANPPVPAGSLIINDDSGYQNPASPTISFPATVYDPATGDFLGYIDTIPAGESGDILPSGISLWHDRYNFSGFELVLLDANFAVITEVTPTTPIGTGLGNSALPIIVSNQTKFYILNKANGKIHTIEEDGTFTQDIATLSPGSYTTMGVSRDGTIAYYPRGNLIKRWDLVNDIALSDLISLTLLGSIGVTDQNGNNGNLLVLANDSIIVNYLNNLDSTTHIIHIAANGTIINDWTFDQVNYAINHLSYVESENNVDEIYVWLFTVANDGDTGTLNRFNLITGVLTLIETTDLFILGGNLLGIGVGGIETTQVFGPSNSCTMVTYGATPSEDGTIIVEKVTVPSDATLFDFSAGGGLLPTTFQLSDGQNQTYTGVTPGSGYSIVETPNVLYTTTYAVSNGSPYTNISVAAGETVTVTVTNTLKGVAGEGDGIYEIIPNKRQDTLWVTFAPPTTQDVEIP